MSNFLNYILNYIFNKPYHKYDIFLSHASEDKSFARPLWEKLKETYIVWYDENNMGWGDTVNKKIEEGLNNSRYGIVILSHHYLAKHKKWTKKEFKTILKKGKIRPILHNITMQEIQKHYPSAYQAIENTLAIYSSDGQDNIISKARKAIGEDSLCTEKGIDYTRLRDLLAAKNWKEADEETYRVMIQAVGNDEWDHFISDKLLNFPCTDLRTIDRLWVKYSNGHFGFSVQKEIYLSVGGKADYIAQAWRKFDDRIGWRVKSRVVSESEVIFDISLPRGHLPKKINKINFNFRLGGLFFSRIETCKL